MRSNFDYCLGVVLYHEGGFVNHPHDPGGMTNLGVTRSVYESFLRRMVTEDEMRELTVNDVRPVYQKLYWNRIKGDNLPTGVDLALFDFAVNAGVTRASKAIQHICEVEVDGKIGPQTLSAINGSDASDLIKELKEYRQEFYESLSHFKTFGKGWTNRNNKIELKALEMV